VHITKLLDSLLLAPHVEVVVMLLPEMKIVRTAFERTRYLLLHDLQCERQRVVFWFADQQMDVLGREHITTDVEVETNTCSFQ
jgi:hypothetical protein